MVQPDVLVCLGATAAQSLLGRQFRVTKMRGVPVESELAPSVVATVHPSSILRAPTKGRDMRRCDFIRDLKAVGKLIKSR